MASMAFDTLQYARRLRAAGFPEPQADVQAELMAEAFGFYAENLLTRDHFTEVLNARFGEFGALMDARFAAQDARMDKRFAEQDAKFEKRFAEQDARMDKRFSEQDAKFLGCFVDQNAGFEKRFGKLERTLFLHTWMLGILVLVMVIPQLQVWLG
ncbi:hypothetical protein CWI75_17960 [Kineobactrum sediminis]|uniref:DUF1640 domain-containing protein n=1 Tax=Kineobactrum sediminis TaxID=1905677 RepID=A0A2N5XXZ5_9GAMM|nr:hypothetical protein [Kineobactrum sediminis]PLW80979.1 hypothetical protein CWI75_17960 [Kineobactrum sediminis]